MSGSVVYRGDQIDYIFRGLQRWYDFQSRKNQVVSQAALAKLIKATFKIESKTFAPFGAPNSELFWKLIEYAESKNELDSIINSLTSDISH